MRTLAEGEPKAFHRERFILGFRHLGPAPVGPLRLVFPVRDRHLFHFGRHRLIGGRLLQLLTAIAAPGQVGRCNHRLSAR